MPETEISKMSDAELVQKSLENIDFFGDLIVRYEQKLLRYIQRISGFSTEESEEILQEVFLKVWKNLREFDQALKFSSWIYRITHNHTISEYRINKIRPHHQTINLDEVSFALITAELNLEDQIDQKLVAQKVQSTLSQLPDKYREVLVLKYFEDKSYEEISDILQKPSGTVATLLNRAKKMFHSNFKF